MTELLMCVGCGVRQVCRGPVSALQQAEIYIVLYRKRFISKALRIWQVLTRDHTGHLLFEHTHTHTPDALPAAQPTVSQH